MIKKLSIKGTISMIVVLPLIVAISVLLFAFAYLIKWIIWIFKFVGIMDAFDYLSYKVKQKEKLNSFFNALTDEDKKTMKNG